MDLRQFTTTPNNLDQQDQRRTSVSSLSSYASSAYGGQTPNSSRLTQSRYFGLPGSSGAPGSSGPTGPTGASIIPNSAPASNGGNHPSTGGNNQFGGGNQQQQQQSWLNQQGMLNVTPWIEQQQEVSNPSSQINVNSIENQNFVNNYGNNLNQQNLNLHQQINNQNQNQNQNLSQQATAGGISNVSNVYQNQNQNSNYDPQSTRVSPSTSNVLPQQNSSSLQNDETNEIHEKVVNDLSTLVNDNDDNDSNNANKITDQNQNQNQKQQSQNDDNDEQQQQQQQNDQGLNEKDDDELIPTAIVIKNIPFAIKKEQLLDVMTKLNLPLPYAFNYHFDNGVFRGLAFANFTSTDETTAVVNLLNGREIGGRKLRVEYKKMLPLAERERIEREKREKRGQLEEQHRSASNVSIASMISAASAPASSIISQNVSQNVSNQTTTAAHVAAAAAAQQHQQQQQQHPQQQHPHQQQQPQGGVSNPNVIGGVGNQQGGLKNINSIIGGGVGNLQPLQQQSTGSERFYAPIPFINNLPIPPQQVDFNDPETLEYYSQLLFFRDDKDKIYNEIAYPSSLTLNHKKIISILCGFLGLLEHYDQNLILIKRRTLIHDPSPLLRSQSHSAIPLLNQQSTGGATIPNNQSQSNNQRFRNQPPPLSQQSASSNRIPTNFNLGGLNSASSNALSSAALLRNNPTPTRVPNLYNQSNQQTPQPQQIAQSSNPQVIGSNGINQSNSNGYFGGQPITQSQSQPTTPGLDAMSRFAPFNQGLTNLNSFGSNNQPSQSFGSQPHHHSSTNLFQSQGQFPQHQQGNFIQPPQNQPPISSSQGQSQSQDDSYRGLSSSSNSSNGGNETPGDINDSLQGLTLSLGENQGSNSPNIWGPRVQPSI
ncbi:Polyadenylate-binding protein, cytoplasmic and nuclear [Wickerhamomyces ciferrii]|uniref:Polyadenylate-binding protein, cytoplasmic and nuclear n=1 Tax=Wickerhamomyces ciferrii (strain ATCC 14091 / BCRC 22168 / CBS 111 / JCM 3599 / NBRC 0793 / NRRL Y-1031 F-60-10) TaxID=1206466 RepID=K0KGW6_WICCF|nr:Polyadenylate-binding protein, cytoplasmic and nuclear [Wickerhamomyces ciferrii]CCH41427.1 Polyadenylate-binding protein, cytoplasmic and nuclear [Wickerhamomyces ciferrii]